MVLKFKKGLNNILVVGPSVFVSYCNLLYETCVSDDYINYLEIGASCDYIILISFSNKLEVYPKESYPPRKVIHLTLPQKENTLKLLTRVKELVDELQKEKERIR